MGFSNSDLPQRHEGHQDRRDIIQDHLSFVTFVALWLKTLSQNREWIAAFFERAAGDADGTN
jgi:hypothetical protein